MDVSKEMIEKLIREVVAELATNNSCPEAEEHCGVKKIALPTLTTRPQDRLDTGNPNDKVYTRDLYTLEESPRLGCGLMEMEDTTFDWTLTYDEIDYVIEGELSIIIDGKSVTAKQGEIVLIPKNSKIQFSVKGKARFIYVTYPADWQSQA